MAFDLSGARGFLFGGDTPWTYEQVQQQRAIADRLRAANAGTPRNVGEGLSAIGRALGARRRENRAERRTGELQAEYEASPAYQAIFGALGGGQPRAQGGASPQPAPQQGGGISETILPPAGFPQSIVDAAMGQDGVSRFNDSLSVTESGGDYSVVNSEGYTGKYQFGPARLQDYNNANNANVTMEAFRANPQLQEQVQRWHVGDIDNFVAQNGLDQYIGQTIGGVTITQDGLRAMAHLGGNAGMKRFLESGGQYNPSDSNGTSLADYAATHAGGGQPATMSAQNRQPQGQQGQIDPRAIMQLMANPMATPEQKQYLGMLLQQQMAAQQPMSESDRIALELQRIELANAQNPQADQGTTDMQNYAFYSQQEAQAGRQPASFNDWRNQSRAAGATQVNVGPQGQQFPDPPKGTVYARDADGNMVMEPDANGYMRPRIVPFASAESEAEAALAAQQAAGAAESKGATADDVVTYIDRALGLMDDSDLNTGIAGWVSGSVPFLPAGRLNSALTTIKGNLGFEALQNMRDNSPTGGALGQVSTFELDNLQSLEGQLNVGMPEADLRHNLNRIRESRQILLYMQAADKVMQRMNIPEDFVSNPEVMDAIKEGVPLGAIWEAYNG